ncbi:MAG: exodeoxyribonuclease VII small subunit [Eubacteriales bacterium]|nr:exodeoxyribonuclease VII small subunit [Eubacteriales bacterium]MDD3349470.1 exodeoxyribonuclease VII small subunit [Eubacteriales bacterium]
MKQKNSDLSFEEALLQLERSAEALKGEEASLEDALKHYEEGMQHYQHCVTLLAEAKKKIEIFDKNKQELKEFQNSTRS